MEILYYLGIIFGLGTIAILFFAWMLQRKSSRSQSNRPMSDEEKSVHRNEPSDT